MVHLASAAFDFNHIVDLLQQFLVIWAAVHSANKSSGNGNGAKP